jgi:hypothetical protein
MASLPVEMSFRSFCVIAEPVPEELPRLKSPRYLDF